MPPTIPAQRDGLADARGDERAGTLRRSSAPVVPAQTDVYPDDEQGGH